MAIEVAKKKAAADAAARLAAEVAATAHAPTLCPSGHPLVDYVEPVGGACDGCSESVKRGQRVMDCRPCNWSE